MESDQTTAWEEDHWIESEQSADFYLPSLTPGQKTSVSLTHGAQNSSNSTFGSLLAFGKKFYENVDVSRVSSFGKSFLKMENSDQQSPRSSVLVPLLKGGGEIEEDAEISDNCADFADARNDLGQSFSLPTTNFGLKTRAQESSTLSSGFSILSLGKDTLGSVGNKIKSAIPSFPSLWRRNAVEGDEKFIAQPLTWNQKIMEVLPVLGVVALGVVGTFLYFLIVNFLWPDRRPAFSLACSIGTGSWVHSFYMSSLYTLAACPYSRDKCDNVDMKSQPGSWHWEPAGCTVPVVDPVQFLNRAQNRRIAFVGDSFSAKLFDSLVCMLAKSEPPLILTANFSEAPNVGFSNADSLKPALQKAWSGKSMGYHFVSRNLSLLLFDSPFMVKATPICTPDHGSNVTAESCREKAVHLDEVDPFWAVEAAHVDFLILSSGSAWREGESADPNLRFFRSGSLDASLSGPNSSVDESLPFSCAMQSVSAWLSDSANFRGKAIVSSFGYSHGSKGCSNGAETSTASEVAKLLKAESAVSKATWQAFGSANVFLLNVPSLSAAERARGPPGCVDWCLAGVPDTWNDVMTAVLINML